MTPDELYARAPESLSSDLHFLRGSVFDHIPELEGNLRQDDPNQRVIIRCYKEFYFDTRRFWRICSVWFDSKPIMIIRNAGREGDDHRSRFVTDAPGYIRMVVYLQTLTQPRCDRDSTIKDEVDPALDIPDLTTFYGDTLDGYFVRHGVIY